MLAYALVGGSWIFLGVLFTMLVGTVYGLYTRTGSGINQRPYANRYGNAPGAFRRSEIGSEISGRDGIASLSSRGTKTSVRKRK
jgi:hypothetical protein